jgi:hypothetical protein
VWKSKKYWTAKGKRRSWMQGIFMKSKDLQENQVNSPNRLNIIFLREKFKSNIFLNNRERREIGASTNESAIQSMWYGTLKNTINWVQW